MSVMVLVCLLFLYLINCEIVCTEQPPASAWPPDIILQNTFIFIKTETIRAAAAFLSIKHRQDATLNKYKTFQKPIQYCDQFNERCEV